MAITTHAARVSDDDLRQLVRRVHARPAEAYDWHEEAELLAERLRRIPQSSLRRRISLR